MRVHVCIAHTHTHTHIYIYIYIYTNMLEKYSNFFFCENLVDLNEARLHEAILNPHINACIFSRLLIASVDDKQHLSKVVFSAVVAFSL